jgi:hypothetical protein
MPELSDEGPQETTDVAVLSEFGPFGAVGLGVAEREQVIDWLHECLNDSKPRSMTTNLSRFA